MHNGQFKNKIQFNIRLLSVLIVLIPLSEPYSLGGISLDTILFFACVLYGFIVNKKHAGYDTSLSSLYFFIYAFTIPNLIALAYGYSNHIISSIIVLLLYLLCIQKVFPQLDYDYMLSRYRILVYIVCCVFVIQELMYLTVGYRFSGLIPYLTLKYEGISMSTFIQMQMTYERSSSLFLEPSHMAQYILPYLAISLGKIKRKFNIISYAEPLLISTILFFLKSGCGIVGLAVIWIFFLLHVKLNPIKKAVFIAIGTSLAVILYNQLASTEIGQSFSNRSSEFDSGASYERSGVIRVIRGFLVYGAEDDMQQLLGVGTGGSIDIIDNSPYKYMFFGVERYLNNVQMLLVGFGIIGAFLYLLHLFKLYNRNSVSARLVLIAFIGISFLESFFFNSKMALYMAFVFADKYRYIGKAY